MRKITLKAVTEKHLKYLEFSQEYEKQSLINEISKLIVRLRHTVPHHLDLAAMAAVESALQKYQGALIVISHDMTFLKNIHIEKTMNI